MAKYYGKIGYAETVETTPGVWTEKIVERYYRGDVRRMTKRWEDGEKVNPDLNVSNEISIVSDPYAEQHFHQIRYIAWAGALWTVKSVTVERPRLRLTIGGVYNGQQT